MAQDYQIVEESKQVDIKENYLLNFRKKIYVVEKTAIYNSPFKTAFMDYNKINLDNIVITENYARVLYYDKNKDLFRPLRINTPKLDSYGVKQDNYNGKTTGYSICFFNDVDSDFWNLWKNPHKNYAEKISQ